jgi:catechol 2,3-dioxygenase-like lactoylglutathione lyase family enzyme
MALAGLDHVNLRTGRLQEMMRFYEDVLGLQSGKRPPFNFDGAWMYCGDAPIVHLVGVERTPETQAPRLEHFALRGDGMADFIGRLKERGVDYKIVVVPGFEQPQVHLYDPDGNHLHIDFAPHEHETLKDEPFTRLQIRQSETVS